LPHRLGLSKDSIGLLTLDLIEQVEANSFDQVQTHSKLLLRDLDFLLSIAPEVSREPGKSLSQAEAINIDPARVFSLRNSIASALEMMQEHPGAALLRLRSAHNSWLTGEPDWA
jgi:hypothetical protein